MDGSAFELEFDGYASVGWSAVVLQPAVDEYRMSISGQLCQPYVDVNGGELMAFIMALRFGMAPVVAVVDSKYVFDGVVKQERAIATSYCYSWAHLRRLAWDLIDEIGGVGELGVRARWIRAHCAAWQVQSGVVSYRDWLGNQRADKTAKSASEQGRVPAVQRAKLEAEGKLVDGVAAWRSAAGSCSNGRDTARRRARPQRAVE